MPQHLEITIQHMQQMWSAKTETVTCYGLPTTLFDYYHQNILNAYVHITLCLTKYTMQLTF